MLAAPKGARKYFASLLTRENLRGLKTAKTDFQVATFARKML